MLVTKTIVFKLAPDFNDILLQTLNEYQRLLNLSFKGRAKELYRYLRSQSPLCSRLICEIIRERRWHKKAKKFNGNSFHLHRTSYRLYPDRLSVVSIAGRIAIPIITGHYQAKHLIGWEFREGKIVKRRKTFYFHLTIRREVAPREINDAVGIDSGLNHLACLSTGMLFCGFPLRNKRKHFMSKRSQLQKRGTRSAKRRLIAIGGREKRFAIWMLHNISRLIVKEAVALGKAIAFEDLSFIRFQTGVRKKQRYLLHSWAFRKLQDFTTYKALEEGIPVIKVTPEFTSQTCPRCGMITRSNRNGNRFRCIFCGFQHNADLVASINIAQRAGSEGLGHGRMPPVLKVMPLARG